MDETTRPPTHRPGDPSGVEPSSDEVRGRRRERAMDREVARTPKTNVPPGDEIERPSER